MGFRGFPARIPEDALRFALTGFEAHWEFLKEIWEGDRYSADEVAARIGIGPIRFDPLNDEFNAALK